MNARTFLAAVAAVCAAFALASAFDADAESAGITCEEWEQGAWLPPGAQAICRRQALMRSY
jgi:hypothetical protein